MWVYLEVIDLVVVGNFLWMSDLVLVVGIWKCGWFVLNG